MPVALDKLKDRLGIAGVVLSFERIVVIQFGAPDAEIAASHRLDDDTGPPGDAPGLGQHAPSDDSLIGRRQHRLPEDLDNVVDDP